MSSSGKAKAAGKWRLAQAETLIRGLRVRNPDGKKVPAYVLGPGGAAYVRNPAAHPDGEYVLADDVKFEKDGTIKPYKDLL